VNSLDATRIPINKEAAIVISKGTHFSPKIKPHCHDERDIIPVVRKVTGKVDLTGMKVGWLTVIGLSEEKNKRWVCRCVCGKYVFRHAKSLQRNKEIEDKCINCCKLDYIKEKTSHIFGADK